jgi:MFS family permease
VGAVLQTTSFNIEMLYGGRFVAGLGIGVMSAVVPLYISECAETAVRGRLISIYQVYPLHLFFSLPLFSFFSSSFFFFHHDNLLAADDYSWDIQCSVCEFSDTHICQR